MTKLGVLGAAAMALSTVLAGAANAQSVVDNRAYCSPGANCLNNGRANPYAGDYRSRGWRDTRNEYYGRNDYGWNNNGWNNSWNTSWNNYGWDNNNYGWNGYGGPRYGSGFWPADVAAGVVGGAIGTAGAIATAPFRGNSYAYYNDRSNGRYGNENGYRGWDTRTYSQRNGFVCEPGKRFKAADGRQHICQ